MKTQSVLPAGYGELFHIDLQKDKRLAGIIAGIGLAVIAVMAVAGHLMVPVSRLFDMSQGMLAYFLRFGSILVGSVGYLVLHEAVHGVFMYAFSKTKPKFGFTGAYAYAGSEVYFCKRHYIIIALAPVVIWGVVLAAVTPLVPEPWFWVVWYLQMFNISGAAGDLYVTWRFSKLPKDILVQDTGVAMTVFGKQD